MDLWTLQTSSTTQFYRHLDSPCNIPEFVNFNHGQTSSRVVISRRETSVYIKGGNKGKDECLFRTNMQTMNKLCENITLKLN